jgi:peptidoglycan/LPS O-acetylase OafA/YrhL
LNRRLDGLTGVRFLAALLVVGHHTLSPSLVRGGLADVPILSDLADLGLVGVTFFFVLSGFVLTWSWDDRRDKVGFYGRRFARVWPLHAITYLLVALAVLPYVGRETPGLVRGVLGLALVQSWTGNVHAYFGGNAVSWSLSCEAFFYAALPFIVPRLAGRGRTAALRTVAACVVVLAVLPLFVRQLDVPRGLLSLAVFPGYRFGEFMIGVVLGWAFRRGWRPSWTLRQATALCVGTYVLATLVLHPVTTAAVRDDRAFVNVYGGLLMLLPFTALIGAVAATDLGPARTWLGSRPMVVLGEASFALYLVHASVILVLAHQGHGHRFLGGLGLTALAVALSVLTSIALHVGVERPVESRIRAVLAAREARRSPALES